MNIFISTDYTTEFAVIQQLNKTLQKHLLTECTIMTTNRPQDKIIAKYAVIKGAELKIFNLDNFVTINTLEKVSAQIDYLVLYSEMKSFTHNKLFEFCDKQVIVDGKRIPIKEYRKILNQEYNDTIKQKGNNKTLYQIYEDLYLRPINNSKRIPIRVIEPTWLNN